MSISKTYLNVLKAMNSWVTVSEWAVKVGEVHPDLLAKAELEAQGHKNETTGLREIAARISSNIARGAFVGHIEINDEERPRKIRYISEQEAKSKEDLDIEEDLAPLTRAQRIKNDEVELSVKERYRLAEFEAIIGQLKTFFNLDFHFEHAKALMNPIDPGKHHPDNIQLLLASHNRIKNSKNWERFSLDEQIEYIRSAVRVQKIVSSRMGIELEEEVIEQIIERLIKVY